MNLLTSARNLFAKQREARTEDTPRKGSAAQARLFNEEATDELVRLLTRVPDLDEVLRQAGLRRSHLRVLTFDDEIAQACETRQDALLGVPIRFEPNEGKESGLLYELMAPFLADAVTGAFQARLYGYSVLEAVYERRADGLIGLKFLGEKPFEWFEPKSDGTLRFFPVGGYVDPEGTLVDQEYKFFLTRARATYRNPYGDAMLSRLYWPWFFRQNGWKFWAKFLERFGAPLLVGKSSDPGAMVQALLLAHSQAVIGIDHNDSVDTVGTSAGNTGEAFDRFEVAILRRIQKVVLGQTLTSGTDGGSGNRALGQVHESVRIDKRNSDIALVRPTIQRIADALCRLNGWQKHEVVFSDEVGLEAERAKRDTDLHKVGVRFSKTYFEDNYELRGEDFTLAGEASDADQSPKVMPEPGDATKPGSPAAAEDASKAGTSAKASKSPSRLFSRGTGGGAPFTPAQQIVEQVGAFALAQSTAPIGREALRSAILKATSPEDLEGRLFALVGDNVSDEQFMELLEQAIYTADVLGYVHSERNES